MKEWKWKIFTIAVIVFVLALNIRTWAAQEKVMGIIAAYDEDGEVLSSWPAFAVDYGEQGILIFTNSKIQEDNAEEYRFLSLGNNEKYNIEFVNVNEEIGLAGFTFSGNSNGVSVLNMASAYKGEEASVHYICDKAEEMELMVEISGYEELENYYIIHGNIVSEEDADFNVPAAMLDDDNNLVGIVTSDAVVSFYLDADNFYGDSKGGERTTNEEETTDKPTEESTKKDSKIKERQNPPSKNTSYNTHSSNKKTSFILICALIGLAVVVITIIVVAVILINKSKKEKNRPVTPYVPTQAAAAIESGPPPMQVNPVSPERKNSKLYLHCAGGVMDGKRYLITEHMMLIGRDISCNIKYPEDTKGISRRHCQIFWKNGLLMIMDLGSTSGTFIRGKGQLSPNVAVVINAGDTIWLGEKKNAFTILMG